MAELYAWGVTAGDASHSVAPPDGWPESTMSYDAVNNTAREDRAVIARERERVSGELVTTGTGDAQIVTVSGTFTLAAGRNITVRVGAGLSNTGPATLNVGSTGARPIVRTDGAALRDGDIVGDGVYRLVYDGTNWRLVAAPAALRADSLSRGDGATLELQEHANGDVRVAGTTGGRIRALNGVRREIFEVSAVTNDLLATHIGNVVLFTGATDPSALRVRDDATINFVGTYPEGDLGMATVVVNNSSGVLTLSGVGATLLGVSFLLPGQSCLLTRVGANLWAVTA